MGGDPMRRNQSLHCQYHQEWGHIIEDCRTLWSHLEQLVKEKVEAIPASAQWIGWSDGVRGLEGHFHKATFGYNQRHPGYLGKDQFSAIQGEVRGSATYKWLIP